jgi:hypothetical protein
MRTVERERPGTSESLISGRRHAALDHVIAPRFSSLDFWACLPDWSQFRHANHPAEDLIVDN